MSLLDQASADLRTILEDVEGFSQPIKLTDPDGLSATVRGLYRDIGQSIDPETGITVVGRTASVVVSRAALAAVGLDVPAGVPQRDRKPWLAEVTSRSGDVLVFKVANRMPDELGTVVLQLEVYE